MASNPFLPISSSNLVGECEVLAVAEDSVVDRVDTVGRLQPMQGVLFVQPSLGGCRVPRRVCLQGSRRWGYVRLRILRAVLIKCPTDLQENQFFLASLRYTLLAGLGARLSFDVFYPFGSLRFHVLNHTTEMRVGLGGVGSNQVFGTKGRN